MRLLVDTNVFLDLFYNRGELAEISNKFLNSTGDHKDVIYVAATSIKDMAYFIKKAYHDNKKTNEYLITIYGKICKIVTITDDDAISALYEDGDYEDNLLKQICVMQLLPITNGILKVKEFVLLRQKSI